MQWSDLDPVIIATLASYGTRVVGALLVLLVGWIAAAWVRRSIARRLERVDFDRTLGLFFAGVGRWLVLLVAALTCMGLFGVPLTTFAAVLAAAGLAVGLALQGTLSHFASGVMLLIFRPFSVGDFVSAGGVTGKVTEIQLFTTTFDTPDNRRIFVPNSLIVGDTIENITYHPHRRMDVAVGTDYGADVDATRAALERATARVQDALEDPAPQVVLQELGGSSVDWTVRVWATTDDFWAVRERTVRAVKQELDAAGIGIPFPQMDVHVDGGLATGSMS